MNILVVSNTYPTNAYPNSGAFVYNLVQEISKFHKVTVLAPKKLQEVFARARHNYGTERCGVIRPLYLSASNRNLFFFNTQNLTDYMYKISVQRSLKHLVEKPDLIYAHFLINAIPMLDYAKINNIPLFIASGESTYASWDMFSRREKARLLEQVARIICVSKSNMERLAELGFDREKLEVIPNAVDYDLFRPSDKANAKSKWGINKDKFTVGFVGHFIERKGPNRIIEAIEYLQDQDIQLVCVGGNGNLKSNSFTKQIKSVPNYLLYDIYSSFDVFVLPTLNEGYCNAIEEAKACCIPIISSKGTSVEEQVDESIGILVEPCNIEQIAYAIKELKSNASLRQSMVENLKMLRGTNSIQQRALKINRLFSNFCSNQLGA